MVGVKEGLEGLNCKEVVAGSREAAERVKHRHGQVAFGETLMVVVLIVFILIIGIVFYYRISEHSLKEEVARRENIAVLLLAERISSLPELACDKYAGVSCTDELRLRALARLLKEEGRGGAYYERLFGYATINVKILTGRSRGEVIPFYDEQPPWEHDQRRQFLFTTLYDPVARSHDLALLNITTYERVIAS